jgi:hypothetical protein
MTKIATLAAASVGLLIAGTALADTASDATINYRFSTSSLTVLTGSNGTYTVLPVQHPRQWQPILPDSCTGLQCRWNLN